MRIDVWSDIACPWCWLGKHNLEEAIRRQGLEDTAQVAFHSFELDPARGETIAATDYLRDRYGDPERIRAGHEHLQRMGAAVGIQYDFARQRIANTFDAHRVHHLAKAKGREDEVVEHLMRADHAEGADLADHTTLRRLAVAAGLDGDDVDGVLGSDAYADAVRADEARAAALGIHGVPFFLIEGRYAVSGAQPVERFEAVLREVARLELEAGRTIS